MASRTLFVVRLVGPLLVALAVLASGASVADASPNVSSLSSSPVTVFGAKWCAACKSLEAGLTDRKIAFEVIDVDDNPSAFARARSASGTSGAIPLTSIVKNGSTTWVLGADVDAVDRAQRD